MTHYNKELVLKKWSFPWSLMEVLIGGKSSIDLKKLSINSVGDAENFIRSYGYDIDNQKDIKCLHSLVVESLHFIEEHLMPKEWKSGLVPPEEILLCEDPKKLLIWASQDSNDRKSVILQRWSCALLKLIHTISHIDDLQRLNNLKVARSQIIGRFQKSIFRDHDGKLWLGDKDNCIELVRVDWKPKKQRDSMILKLLHKPANVADTIYDLIGVRIVTKKYSETILAVKFLRQFHLIDFANSHPSRARNTLIDIEQFKSHVDMLTTMVKNNQLNIENFVEMIENPSFQLNSKKQHNPHSSRDYRSIQITCRQRVRYKDPKNTWQEKLAEFLRTPQLNLNSEMKKTIESISQLAQNWGADRDLSEVSVFFPFEVQIMHEEAALLLEDGDASHDKYKKAQIRTARKRILNEVLNI